MRSETVPEERTVCLRIWTKLNRLKAGLQNAIKQVRLEIMELRYSSQKRRLSRLCCTRRPSTKKIVPPLLLHLDRRLPIENITPSASRAKSPRCLCESIIRSVSHPSPFTRKTNQTSSRTLTTSVIHLSAIPSVTRVGKLPPYRNVPPVLIARALRTTASS